MLRKPARGPTRRQALLAVAAAVAMTCSGCNFGGNPPPSEGPSLPTEASAAEEPMRLVFTVPMTTWRADSAIDGNARLEVTGGQREQVSGSGAAIIAFQFEEVGGRRKMGPALSADCARYDIVPDKPQVSGITKSGAWGPEDPDADFYQRFFSSPDIRLPAGRWTITAIATFYDGIGCSGRPHVLRAPLQLQIES